MPTTIIEQDHRFAIGERVYGHNWEFTIKDVVAESGSIFYIDENEEKWSLCEVDKRGVGALPGWPSTRFQVGDIIRHKNLVQLAAGDPGTYQVTGQTIQARGDLNPQYQLRGYGLSGSLGHHHHQATAAVDEAYEIAPQQHDFQFAVGTKLISRSHGTPSYEVLKHLYRDDEPYYRVKSLSSRHIHEFAAITDIEASGYWQEYVEPAKPVEERAHTYTITFEVVPTTTQKRQGVDNLTMLDAAVEAARTISQYHHGDDVKWSVVNGVTPRERPRTRSVAHGVVSSSPF